MTRTMTLILVLRKSSVTSSLPSVVVVVVVKARARHRQHRPARRAMNLPILLRSADRLHRVPVQHQLPPLICCLVWVASLRQRRRQYQQWRVAVQSTYFPTSVAYRSVEAAVPMHHNNTPAAASRLTYTLTAANSSCNVDTTSCRNS
uniref:Putative secreted protein n=1 Tax=Anopheles darlingi TaxID=43151 RepID=A0A2M4DEQ7_ANODA